MMPLATKKDYVLISVIGLLLALLVLPVLKNLDVSFWNFSLPAVFGLIIAAVAAANAGLFAADWLGQRIFFVWQFAKFAAVGALNTLIDLGILNVLLAFSSVHAGWGFAGFKAISFVVANVNAYFWNKHWVFVGTGNGRGTVQYAQFLAVSTIGLLLNDGAASLVVNFLARPENISAPLWANIGALTATFVSLIWNFLGYKFVVFKSKTAVSRF